MDLIREVLESTAEFEAPRRFYYWATLSSISAVLKDSVWFDMGKNYKLYPNIYVLLFGPSGVRKGPAISIAERIVKYVDNTRLINGRASIEAIIKDLGSFTTRPGKPPLKDSCGFVVASELSSSIISNPSAMDIMTNLFDRIYNTDEWKYRLKVGESHTLKNPTITWLSATNEALFKDFIPEKNLQGGLIGRMYLISENRPNKLNSLMFSPNKVPVIETLGKQLAEIAKLTGEFTMSEDLRHEVNNWYVKFMTDVGPKLNDDTGFVSRILDFVIKNAMLIAAGRNCSLEITPEVLKESLDVTQPLIYPTKKVTQKAKDKDRSEISKRGLILSYIANKDAFEAERTEILRSLGLQINHEDLDNTVNFLLNAQVLVVNNGAGVIRYKLKMDNPKVKTWIEENFKK